MIDSFNWWIRWNCPKSWTKHLTFVDWMTQQFFHGVDSCADSWIALQCSLQNHLSKVIIGWAFMLTSDHWDLFPAQSSPEEDLQLELSHVFHRSNSEFTINWRAPISKVSDSKIHLSVDLGPWCLLQTCMKAASRANAI